MNNIFQKLEIKYAKELNYLLNAINEIKNIDIKKDLRNSVQDLNEIKQELIEEWKAEAGAMEDKYLEVNEDVQYAERIIDEFNNRIGGHKNIVEELYLEKVAENLKAYRNGQLNLNTLI